MKESETKSDSVKPVRTHKCMFKPCPKCKCTDELRNHHINSTLSYRLTRCPLCTEYVLTDFTFEKQVVLSDAEGLAIEKGDYGMGIKLSGEFFG